MIIAARDVRTPATTAPLPATPRLTRSVTTSRRSHHPKRSHKAVKRRTAVPQAASREAAPLQAGNLERLHQRRRKGESPMISKAKGEVSDYIPQKVHLINPFSRQNCDFSNRGIRYQLDTDVPSRSIHNVVLKWWLGFQSCYDSAKQRNTETRHRSFPLEPPT